MTTPERRALVVTTPVAAGERTNGATLRADEVVALLQSTGHAVVRSSPSGLQDVPGTFDLGVAVSYACAPVVRVLRRRTPRTWLDAVDSWLLVDGTGLRSGRASYLVRALRDGTRLAAMPRPDLVTYISRADLAADRGTVRALRHLVLPGQTPAPTRSSRGEGRRVVLAGDWTYPPNRDGLQWFTAQVLPALEARLSGRPWSVAVYGTGLSGAPPSARVRHLGYAPDHAELYRDGDVHAAPVRFGAGVKRKVLQPLLAGLPVVTTPAGAHGLRAHSLLDVRPDAGAFAAALADRLRSEPVGTAPTPGELFDRDDTRDVLAWLRA